ncbi:hypothetical protein [Embleya sp. AB8]|uniref:hypothetical protein n=1 Tax=Embleya sp. AB8 TaxID=3156304 RepID=UPI003C74657D
MLISVSVVLLGMIVGLVVLSFGRRDNDAAAGSGLLRVGAPGETDRAEAGRRALGGTAWMRGGGGGVG